MYIVFLGAVLICVSLYLMTSDVYMRYLHDNEYEQWVRIRGREKGFVVFMDSIALFSWTLEKGYDGCLNPETKRMGEVAYKRARNTARCMLLGISIIILPLCIALFSH